MIHLLVKHETNTEFHKQATQLEKKVPEISELNRTEQFFLTHVARDERVEQVLKSHASNPMALSLFYKDYESARFLIENGYDVNEKNERGCTALHIAAAFNAKDTVIFLLSPEFNTIVDIGDGDGHSPFTVAVTKKRFYIANLLLEAGANVDWLSKKSNTVLYNMCAKGDVEAVSYLISKKANVHDGDNTPLMVALYHGHIKIAQMLVDAGANIDDVSSSLTTALHWVCKKRGVLEAVEFCLSNAINADPNISDYLGVTPLMAAAQNGYFEIIKKLVAAGANINATDLKGNTALKLAEDNERNDCAEYLRGLMVKS